MKSSRQQQLKKKRSFEHAEQQAMLIALTTTLHNNGCLVINLEVKGGGICLSFVLPVSAAMLIMAG